MNHVLCDDHTIRDYELKDNDTIITVTAATAERMSLEERVSSDDNKAKTKLAWYKLTGFGDCEIDVDYAVTLLIERVKDKDTEAMWMLGLCYEFGMGCDQDIEEAQRLYEESKDCGNVIGEFILNNGRDCRGSGN